MAQNSVMKGAVFITLAHVFCHYLGAGAYQNLGAGDIAGLNGRGEFLYVRAVDKCF
ncbi:MAG: hypothetical protein WBY44_04120 [Bryobacteraceae bacterium]